MDCYSQGLHLRVIPFAFGLSRCLCDLVLIDQRLESLLCLPLCAGELRGGLLELALHHVHDRQDTTCSVALGTPQLWWSLFVSPLVGNTCDCNQASPPVVVLQGIDGVGN